MSDLENTFKQALEEIHEVFPNWNNLAEYRKHTVILEAFYHEDLLLWNIHKQVLVELNVFGVSFNIIDLNTLKQILQLMERYIKLVAFQ